MSGNPEIAFRQKFWALVQLSRPVNVAIGMASIAVGAWVTGTLQPFNNVLLACLSAGMITAAANAINDYFDISIDRVNKPYRPLPSGRLRPQRAFQFALLLFGLGCAVSWFIRPLSFGIAVVASVLLFLYSWFFKRTVLWGNFVVSLLSALAFVYGGVAVYRLRLALIPAGFAFLFHLGREILKDLEDVEGDRLDGAVTFPVRYGPAKAKLLITCIFLLLILVTVLPYRMGVFGEPYLWTVLFGVDLFLVVVIVFLWKSSSRIVYRRLSNWLKADMLVGLLAVFLGVSGR